MKTDLEYKVEYFQDLVMNFAGLAQLSDNSLDEDAYEKEMMKYSKLANRFQSLLEQEKLNEFNAS